MASSRLMNIIEQRTKPHSSESFGQVSSHWKLIRDSVQNRSEDPKQFDKQQPKTVGHGVHAVRTIPAMENDLQSVVYNSYSGNYIGIDPEGRITMYLPSGYRERNVKYLQQPIHGLVYASKTRQYVGWGHDENIKLISDGFKVISATSSISQISCGVFNETTNEVITGGAGNITCWSFRYGAKFLLQRKVLTDQLPSSCIIKHLCLEDTPSRAQRCFAVYNNNVIVYTLLDGTCVAHYRDIHSREITAVLYFNPLKYLVTASKDGSIKVWDDKGNVKTIFIGHLKAVSALTVYPFGPYIMSGSADCTIRVWSLDTSDEVDRIQTAQPVMGLGSMVGKDDLYSFSSSSLDLWKIEHVHSVFTTVGCKVKSIKTTTHPRVPTRMVCVCSDATVRMISPGSGACITTLLVPNMQTVADVVCAAADNVLFTLLTNGVILKASTLTNPCKIVQQWKKEDTKVPSTCTCLCLYEYIVEDKLQLETDNWGGLVSSMTTRQTQLEESQNVPTSSSYDRTLLLGGCVDGTIVVYDWMNRKTPGAISFQIEAHREEVVTMVANPSVDQVLSAGLDNCIKVWRLFPFAQEALAPLMTLYCQETPRHLAVAHHRLCVALHEPATAAYNVVVFKTTQKERFDHNSDDDHTDDITGVASCPKMRIFASCSTDGSVRIWDEANNLLRVITLNALPTSLCFCSQKGDLLVGIGNHLHKIEYATYIPRSYIYRMVAMEFQRATAEKPLPIDDTVLAAISGSDRQRLTRAKSSLFKFTHFADLLSPEEMNEKVEEEERRSQAFSKLQQREAELKKLRDGLFEFQKRRPRPNSELVRRNGFQKYLEIFYKRPDVEIPEEDELNEEKVPEYKEEDVFAPDRQPTGFFAIDMNALQKKPQPEKPVKEEIMCLSMPEFQPEARPTSPQVEEADDVTRDFVESREGFTPHDLEMEDKDDMINKDQKATSRASTAPIHRRIMEIGPPLIGQDRERYIVEVPKTERYPSSTHCRQMNARRVARMANRIAEGKEAFVIAPDGFIPNSVVVSLFKDLKKEVKEEHRIWKPPTLTEEQLAELLKRKKKSKSPEVEPVVPKKKSPTKSNFAEQLKFAMRDIPSPEPEPEEDIMRSPTPTPPPSPTPKEPTPPPTPKPSPPKEVKPKKPIEKFISRPKPPTPPPAWAAEEFNHNDNDHKTEPEDNAYNQSKSREVQLRRPRVPRHHIEALDESSAAEMIKRTDYSRYAEIITGKVEQRVDDIMALAFAGKKLDSTFHVEPTDNAESLDQEISFDEHGQNTRNLQVYSTSSQSFATSPSSLGHNDPNTAFQASSCSTPALSRSTIASPMLVVTPPPDRKIIQDREQDSLVSPSADLLKPPPFMRSFAPSGKVILKNKNVPNSTRNKHSRHRRSTGTSKRFESDVGMITEDKSKCSSSQKMTSQSGALQRSDKSVEVESALAMASQPLRRNSKLSMSSIAQSTSSDLGKVSLIEVKSTSGSSSLSPAIKRPGRMSPIEVVSSFSDEEPTSFVPFSVSRILQARAPDLSIFDSVLRISNNELAFLSSPPCSVSSEDSIDSIDESLIERYTGTDVHVDTILSCIRPPSDDFQHSPVPSLTGNVSSKDLDTCFKTANRKYLHRDSASIHFPGSSNSTHLSNSVTSFASIEADQDNCEGEERSGVVVSVAAAPSVLTDRTNDTPNILDAAKPENERHEHALDDDKDTAGSVIPSVLSYSSNRLSLSGTPARFSDISQDEFISHTFRDDSSQDETGIDFSRSNSTNESWNNMGHNPNVDTSEGECIHQLSQSKLALNKTALVRQECSLTKEDNVDLSIEAKTQDSASLGARSSPDYNETSLHIWPLVELGDHEDSGNRSSSGYCIETHSNTELSVYLGDSEASKSQRLSTYRQGISPEVEFPVQSSDVKHAEMCSPKDFIETPPNTELSLHPSGRDVRANRFSSDGSNVITANVVSLESLGDSQFTTTSSATLSECNRANVPKNELSLCDNEDSEKLYTTYVSSKANTPPTYLNSQRFRLGGPRQNRHLVSVNSRSMLQRTKTMEKLDLPSLRSPTPPREPTPPPPPPTPLPEFITQFMGTLWFEKFFPNAQSDTFPKPWSVSNFIDELLKILPKCNDFELKTQILAAIMLLNRQDPLERECSERVSRALIAELNVPDPPSAHGPSNAKQFLKVDMQLLQAMKIYNISLVAELMSQYVDGDEEVRQFVQEMFVTIGIHDPGSFFPQELDSFEIHDLPGNRRKARVREMCLKWLDKWLKQFKEHIRSLAGKIGRAQAGSVVKGTKTPKTPSTIKGILKKEDGSEAPSKSPAVKFDMEALGSVAADIASPVEAVNYFCEMRMQDELEKAKARARVKTPPQAKDNSRNTILILPKIHSKRSLARLGETHCSHCHPERETSLSLAFPLPPIYAHRKEIPLSNVSLRLKTMTLNPFPEEADIQLYEAARHAQLVTLRSAQKYFIPSQSYVQREPLES